MAQEKETIEIQFEGLSLGEAGVKADELRKELLDIKNDPDGDELESITLEKESQDTQDFGTTLVLVLGTPAVIALARGLTAYLGRTGTRVVIKKEGDIVVQNVGGDDVARIVEALKAKKQR
jgi:hypothetical protein